jgi:recombination protein RecA
MFYPPDIQQIGVDLEALAVVRVKGAQNAARAADRLIASNAFGLIVMDLGSDAWFPRPLQNRLIRRAESHESALVCVTREGRDARHLGQMVSLRVEARLSHCGDDTFQVELRATKDKRRRPGWRFDVGCKGTIGLY